MSGSGGAGGYDYQADAFAYVASHAICHHRLAWFDDFDDTPSAIASETNGPGDDFGIETQSGIMIEVQAKHGLSRGIKFEEAVHRIFEGLVRDPLLRGVLLVDATASRPIQDDFRNDILRLADGRRDGLKESTQLALSQLSTTIGTDLTVFRRFRVIVADLAEGASARGIATALLREVVADPSATSTAWDVLGKDGFRQMSRRGRRDAESLIQFLATRVGLRRLSTNLSVAAEAYRLWRVEASKQFFVPGVGVNLPIDQAWIGLRLLDSESDPSPPNSIAKLVQSYHEWERLADNALHINRVDAEHLLVFNTRVVVLGGPGSGKSTLADRITWRAARDGRRVVKVRLRIIAAAILEGHTFDRALISTAADSSGLSIEVASTLLASPAILIADGLDETDPNRASIAQALIAWSASHPQCRVCILTRPVGHEPGLLPGFRHVELLPLDREAIHDHARRLFQALVGGEQVDKYWSDFMSIVHDSNANHRAATLAARNPLLLGFLVRLHADGMRLGKNRAVFYDQIIEIFHASKIAGRETESVLDAAVSNRVLDILGWFITRSPAISQSEVIREIAKHLEGEIGIPRLKARQLAEQGLIHWEDRRLIERLTAGTQQAYVFLHPSLGEFAAARYAAAHCDTDFEAWLNEARTEARWRQPLLLCAGLGQVTRIVPQLVAMDRPEDPTSTECVLAAAILTELEEGDRRLSGDVIERLSARLNSPLPIVAVEAAAALLPMAAYARTALGPLAARLIDHPQPWNRLAGMALAIATGREFVTAMQVRAYLEQLVPTHSFGIVGQQPSPNAMPSEAADLEFETIRAGLEMLFQELPTEEAGHVAEILATNGAHAYRTVEIAENYLQIYDQKAVLERLRTRGGRQFGVRSVEDYFPRKASRAATQSFLDAVFAAPTTLPPPIQPRIDRQLLNLAAVHHAMRLMEVPLGDWYVIGRRESEDVLTEAIRATIMALEIDPISVREEAAEALARLGDDDDWLFHVLPAVTVVPDWSKCRDTHIDSVLLAKGLFHSCVSVVLVSAEALCRLEHTTEVSRLIQLALERGHEKTLRILAHCIEDFWGKSSVKTLLARLRQPLTEGCEHLFRPLLVLASSDQMTEVWDTLRYSIETGSPEIANGAIEALSKSELLKPDAEVLHALFEHWTTRRSTCVRCASRFDGKFCPTCHIGVPNPRAGLVRMLIDRDFYAEPRILELCADADQDVAKAASAALAKIAVSTPEHFQRILCDVNSGQSPISILMDVLSLPASSLRLHSVLLAEFANSQLISIRLAIIRSLPSGWADMDTAQQLATRAINDPDPAVRTQAVRSLRALM